MSVLSWPRRILGRSTPSKGRTAKETAETAADDVVDGAGEVGRRTMRPVAAALGGGAVVGSGAYAYGEQQDTAQDRERTARYNEYQQRVQQIESMYQRGEISKEEMERRKEQAWQAYRQSQGDENAGITFTEFLAELGTFQMLALAALAGFSVYVIAPRFFAALEGTPTVEGLLG